MSGANQRSALAELAAARATVARLDAARDPEENAADLIEAWSAVETALRSLVGGAVLSGEPLVRDVRQRNLISIGQAHALLGFLATRDRVQRTEYRPTADDLGAARAGFQQLEEALRAGQTAAIAGALDTGLGAPPGLVDRVGAEPVVVAPRARGTPWVWIVLSLLLVAFVGFGGWRLLSRSREPAELTRGVELFSAGRREEARRAFALAARDHPDLALPHIFLGRIAREEGDLGTAGKELGTAVSLEPKNALAHRELGALFLVRREYDAARRSYVRALDIDPSDRMAQGYLGCSLVRLGRLDEGTRWINRAGQGEWVRCAQAGVPVTPGALPPT